MPNWSKGGSGNIQTDYYRETKGLEAANVLGAGYGISLVSGDHLNAGELCIEVIVRLRSEARTKGRKGMDDVALGASARSALRAGLGTHVAQGDHAGADTCVQTIAKATK